MPNNLCNVQSCPHLTKQKNGNSLTHEPKTQNNDVQLLNYVHTDAIAMFAYLERKRKKKQTPDKNSKFKWNNSVCTTVCGPHRAGTKLHSGKHERKIQ